MPKKSSVLPEESVPWLSTDTIAVLQEKAKAKIQNNTVKRKRLQGVFKARHDREVFLNNLCDELETDIGQNHLGPALKAIRLLSGKRKEVTGTTFHKSDVCLSEEETLKRWREHFISTLNHHPGVPSNEFDK